MIRVCEDLLAFDINYISINDVPHDYPMDVCPTVEVRKHHQERTKSYQQFPSILSNRTW